jgi:tetratricopeptide (TPR) repeat protein
MTRPAKPGNPVTRRRPTTRLSLPAAGAWTAFRAALRNALAALDQDAYLIIRAMAAGRFVQFAGQGSLGMRAEAVSNTFITRGAPLSVAACRDLVRLGWHPPTYVPTDGVPDPEHGSPNFYVDSKTPVPYGRLATLAVKTLRQIYRVRHPGGLTYKAFSEDKTSIRFPLPKIQREAAVAAEAGSATPLPQQTAVGATKTPSSPTTLVLPDGQPIAADQLEADLRARIAKCEEELEVAVWQLARFYSAVGRCEEAAACVTKAQAGTQNPAKQATVHLRLGQLLEQQDRHAEAEPMYARGLDFPSAASQVLYLLHNNRGYCLNVLRRHAEAEAQCCAAIAIDPSRHNAHKNLGLALAGQGRLAEAARCLLEADCRCPDDTRARGHLTALLTEDPEILDADPGLAAACRDQGIRPGRVGSA